MALTVKTKERLHDIAVLKQLLINANNGNETSGIRNESLFMCNIIDNNELEFHDGFLKFIQRQLRLIDTKYKDLLINTLSEFHEVSVTQLLKYQHGVWKWWEFKPRIEFLNRVEQTLKSTDNATQKKNNKTNI